MNAPVMLAPILRTPTGDGPEIAAEEAVAIIRTAAANARLVMPPRAAKFFEQKLNEVADTAEGGGNVAWFVVNQWLDQVDEINAYAARVRTEYEVFLAGSSPDDATHTAPAETREAALNVGGWFTGAGVAHRPVIQLYGPWVIDRPAATAKESAA